MEREACGIRVCTGEMLGLTFSNRLSRSMLKSTGYLYKQGTKILKDHSLVMQILTH